MITVWVDIPTALTWPSTDEIDARNRVIDALSAAGIGRNTGTGGGMGEMDFSFQVADESVARAAIERAMQEFMPGVLYRVRVIE